MNHRIVRFARLSQLLGYLTLAVYCSVSVMAQNDGNANTSGSTLHATHILGFDTTRRNSSGDISIQNDALEFHPDEGSSARIALKSIRTVFFGEEDKEIGGTPMAVGRVAAPFGGGRVIGLFAHKKYVTVTVEYLDQKGGFHGAIFQIDKKQGQVLENDLQGQGVRVAGVEYANNESNPTGGKHESK